MIAPREQLASALALEVEKLFSIDGVMSEAKKFEYRESQQQMAVAVAESLENKHALIVEAGTGVGKSLGYLIPSILYARRQNKKAVISTHTINLQEQLLHKDIPLARKILKEDFAAVILKGRQNYLCPRRLERAMRNPGDLFLKAEAEELKRIWEWSKQTKDGTLSDFRLPPDPKVWHQVCSEAHVCTARTCGNNAHCFFQNARVQAQLAPVVIVNHSLFFSLVSGFDPEDSLNEKGYLFANDFVVFDEAHTLENVASKHLGFTLSKNGIRGLLQRLFHPKNQKGILQMLRQSDSIRTAVELMDQFELFFGGIENQIEFKKSNEIRIRKPDLVEDSVALPLIKLHRQLLDLAEDQEDESLKMELQDYARRLEAIKLEISDFLTQGDEGMVYWVEKTGKAGQDLQLCAAPIDVAPRLEKILFRNEQTAIFTSATLSVGKGLTYFQKRVGGTKAPCLQLSSPFDYAKQMTVYVPKSIPDPTQTFDYENALSRWIKHFTEMTGGKALVLFTSYKTLKSLTEKLRPYFIQKRIQLFSQADPIPRHQLLQDFRENIDSVLLGTESFWQGVDVPGESLSNVIITRLPFQVPDHPLIEAKLEHIRSQGGDPFREYSLPEAILKFRQGIGRLIRSKHDTGIVAILDNRIITKPYGKAFLSILPDCPVKILE